MSDFNFFLNRQGIQGRKGDKGDAGFTPTISVSEQTLNSYKLKIANEYNEFETPNLIGNLGVTDNGGTYLRYDPTSGTVSTGEIDGATTEVVGGVRKSTDADLTNLSADTAVTPANVADMLPLLLEAGTDNVTITQDEATSKTKISVAGGGSAPTNMVTTDTAQDITANKTFYGEIRVGADNNYATLAKFSKEAIQSGDSTLLEHIDLGEANFLVTGDLGKKVYETDKYVYKKYINVDDLSDNHIKMDNSISSQVARMAMPSNKYIDLTLGASGSTYTAPANGYFQLAVLDGTSIQLYNQTKSSFWKASTSGGSALVESIECQAGDIIQCYYTYTKFRWFRFYYAEGSK